MGELRLSHLILQFNPEEFLKAVLFAGGILQRTIRAEKTGLNLSSEEISRIESERICLNSLREREDSRIVVLPQFCSWKKTISRTAEALFVIFPNFLGEMMIQCVPPPFDNFSQKKPLPKEWAGLQGDDFVQETGVPDAIFCHRRRFIGGAKFLEGALALAKLACQA